MSGINKPLVSTEPKQTIFGNSYSAQDFPKAAVQGLNAIDYFYRSARRRGAQHDLQLLAPVSAQKTFDYLFEKALYARRFFKQVGFNPDFIVRERSEGDNEDSFGFFFEHPMDETRFSVTIKLIQP